MHWPLLYNDLLQNEGHRIHKQASCIHLKYQQELSVYNQSNLSFLNGYHAGLNEILETEMESQRFHPEYMPVNQFMLLPPSRNEPLPIMMGLLGSGSGAQPFKSIQDYENWLKRIHLFTIWVDTAISNFNKGITAGIVLPRALVIKMIPQLENLAQEDSGRNIFFGPVRNFPADFLEGKKKLLKSYYISSLH
jgi:uncharacterized protein (DUF885 family)